MSFGFAHWNKPVPKVVTIICNGVNAILGLAAGYQAFSDNAKTVFILMATGLVIDKIVKPLFGEEAADGTQAGS